MPRFTNTSHHVQSSRSPGCQVRENPPRSDSSLNGDTGQWTPTPTSGYFRVTFPDGSPDWIWREDAMSDLLRERQRGEPLRFAGCKTNQGRFYGRVQPRRTARLRAG